MFYKLLYLIENYYYNLEIVFSVIKHGFSEAIFISLLDKPERNFFYNAYFIIYRLIGYFLLFLFYLGFFEKTDYISVANFLQCIAVSSVYFNLFFVLDMFTFLRININRINKLSNIELSNNIKIENLKNPIDLPLIYLIKLTYKLTIYLKLLLEIIFIVYSFYFLVNMHNTISIF
uniref:Uncharacterized protein n=1 Tax=Cyclocybe aegerita TaxID=1973307 RepID=A0A884P6J7_CYCAE|nr:hypothetical protein K4014_mgp20 [Cyclocybe aegerita]QQP21456.1 hypothetical protein [Cyclocybe aegerita]